MKLINKITNKRIIMELHKGLVTSSPKAKECIFIIIDQMSRFFHRSDNNIQIT